ncbi:MAG: hypothetical protein IPM07_14290 [Anaerolineales bacterium]|nr:hypothetical protein [Anaerolineales bacterium]
MSRVTIAEVAGTAGVLQSHGQPALSGNHKYLRATRQRVSRRSSSSTTGHRGAQPHLQAHQHRRRARRRYQQPFYPDVFLGIEDRVAAGLQRLSLQLPTTIWRGKKYIQSLVDKNDDGVLDQDEQFLARSGWWS